jgi:hypothetical protein
MSKTQHALTTFERPRCPHCQAKMMLECVSSGPIGFEHRLFECPKCDHVETIVVASDPFKSKAQGWLSGELGRGLGAATREIKNGKLIAKPAE